MSGSLPEEANYDETPLSKKADTSHKSQVDTAEKSVNGLIAVRLAAENWKALLQNLYLEGQTQDRAWQEWRLTIRREVLLSVNTPSESPFCTIFLAEADWYKVLNGVRAACRMRGKVWMQWCDRLEKQVKAEIAKKSSQE